MRVFLLSTVFLVFVINSLTLQVPDSCSEYKDICDNDDAAAAIQISTLCGGDASCITAFTGASFCQLIDGMTTTAGAGAIYRDATFPVWLQPFTSFNATTTQLILADQADLTYAALWGFVMSYQSTGMPAISRKYANLLQCTADNTGLNWFAASDYFNMATACMVNPTCLAALGRVTTCSTEAGVPLWVDGAMSMPRNIDEACEMFECSADESSFEVAGVGSIGFVDFWTSPDAPWDMQVCMDKIEEEIMTAVGKLVFLVAIIGTVVGMLIVGIIWCCTCCCCKKKKKVTVKFVAEKGNQEP